MQLRSVVALSMLMSCLSADGAARTLNPAATLFAQSTDTAAVAPAAPVGKIYELESGITPPKLLRQDTANGPCNLIGNSNAKTGTVMLSLIVTEAGEAIQVKAYKAPSVEMASCAVQTVQQYHFTPALRKKSPVSVHMILAINFQAK